MRAKLGAGLLLLSTALVGVVATPAEAASVCDDGLADTTWVGPATQDGSASWAEPSNWSGGVPTATSSVCIPHAIPGPRVLEGSTASAGVVTLEGTLTVAGSLDVATLDGDFGELNGPGTTTVTARLSGYWLTLQDAAVVDLRANAALGGELFVYDGARLNVQGDTVLEPDARIDSLSDNPGLFTITQTGSLTFDTPNESAELVGGFANHGTVTVTAGYVLMMGADPADAHPAQFSTGAFTGAPEATFSVSNTELRDGARLDHLWGVDHITVPAGASVTLADSDLHYMDPTDPSLSGAGEVVATGSSFVGGRIGGALTLTVPAGQVLDMGEAIVEDEARIRVDGELHTDELTLNNDAVLDIFGVHRGVRGGTHIAASSTDPGLEIIHPAGQLLSGADGGVLVTAPLVNHGIVDSRSGFIYLGPAAESPMPSSGVFRAGAGGTLLLGSNGDGDPPLVLDQADIEGVVQVTGEVQANDLDLRGDLGTQPGGSTTRAGTLQLTGSTTLANGASLAGDVVVGGQLEADLGATGSASLSGAAVTGQVHVMSGTLSVPNLAPTTLTEDGTLTQGQWVAAPGATLDLPTVKSNDAWLNLTGPGASFGDGLATLTGIGPNGNLLLGGDDLAVPGRFRNEGVLSLAPGSRLDVAGKFRQLATGTLVTWLDSAERGTVRAAGPRELAGELRVERVKGYKPPRGTDLNFITSSGREGVGEFDSVLSPPFGANDMRKFRVDYGRDHVRLRVVGVD